jgi:hypothetical protein
VSLEQGRQAAGYLNGLVVAYLRAVERAQLVGRWLPVARCESGDNIYAVSPGGSFRGWLQFDRASWNANGGSGDPYGQSRAEAARVAENYRRRAGTSPWPVCGSRYGG